MMRLLGKVPSVVRQLARLQTSYGLSNIDVGLLAEKTRNRKAAGVWWGAIKEGNQHFLLDDADRVARELGGRLEVTHQNPWAGALVAIRAIPEDEIGDIERDTLLTLLGKAYWRKHPEGPIPDDLNLRPSAQVLRLIERRYRD